MFGGLGVRYPDPAQHAVPDVHGGLRQLIGVHLTQTLVALDGFFVPAVLFLQAAQQGFEFAFRVRVHHLVGLRTGIDDLHAVQRWNRGVDAPGFHERAHVAVKECQKQGADVRPVHIRVGHHDDLAVASGVHVETASRSRADHLDQRGALGIGEHVRDGRLLDVENLSANGQQRLVIGVTRQPGRAQGRIALHDEQLGATHVCGAAFHQLGGHGRGFQRVLAPLGFLVHARRDPGLHFRNHFVQHLADLRLVIAFLRRQLLGQLGLDHLGDNLTYRGCAQNLLGLTLELWFGQANREHGGEARQDVVLFELVIADLEFAGVGIHLSADGLQQCRFKTGQVRTTLGRGNDVDERAHGGVVADPPPECDIHFAHPFHVLQLSATGIVQNRDALREAALPLQPPHVRDRRVNGEELGEFGDTTVVLEHLRVGAVFPRCSGEKPFVTDSDL